MKSASRSEKCFNVFLSFTVVAFIASYLVAVAVSAAVIHESRQQMAAHYVKR
jgi:hypothetical protein